MYRNRITQNLILILSNKKNQNLFSYSYFTILLRHDTTLTLTINYNPIDLYGK